MKIKGNGRTPKGRINPVEKVQTQHSLCNAGALSSRQTAFRHPSAEDALSIKYNDTIPQYVVSVKKIIHKYSIFPGARGFISGFGPGEGSEALTNQEQTYHQELQLQRIWFT